MLLLREEGVARTSGFVPLSFCFSQYVRNRGGRETGMRTSRARLRGRDKGEGREARSREVDNEL